MLISVWINNSINNVTYSNKKCIFVYIKRTKTHEAMTQTITKQQIISLEPQVKALVNKEGGSFCDRMEKVLLTYDNVYTDSFGNVMVRLSNGTHVSLYDII